MFFILICTIYHRKQFECKWFRHFPPVYWYYWSTRCSASLVKHSKVSKCIFRIEPTAYLYLKLTIAVNYISMNQPPWKPDSPALTVAVPRTWTLLGSWAFWVTDSKLWNSLPGSIHSVNSLMSLRSKLKIYCFENIITTKTTETN